MNEFSCRVLIGMVEMAEAGGIPRERLLYGFRHSPEHIMNPRNRSDWETGMELTRRARREAGSREAYLALGQHYGKTPGYRYLRYFTAAIFDPIHLYTYPNQVFAKMSTGPHLRWTWKHLGPRELELSAFTDEEHPAPVEYWEINLICFSKLPSLLGMPDAEGEILDHSPLHCRYRFRMPPSGTLWARGKRFLFRQNPPPNEDQWTTAPEATSASVATAAECASPSDAATGGDREISCRIIIGLVEMAEASGLDRRFILEGWRQSPAELLRPQGRTDWETLRGVVARLREASPSHEAFLDMARLYGHTAAFGFFRRLAAGTFSPAHFFSYPNAAVVRLSYGRTFRYDWKKLSPRHVEFTYTLRDGLTCTRDFWEFQAATMANLPCLIGLPPAIVEISSCTSRSATSRATLPPSGTLWARAGRFLRMHGTSPDPAFAIFAQQHEDLRHSYEVLNQTEQERAALAKELLRTAEAERTQFARDVHDGIGQELFALKLQAERVAREAGGESAESAARLAQLVLATQRHLSAMARGYDPIVGAGGSFSDAVRQLAEQTGVEFDLADLQDVPLSAPSATHLYRVAQEAVTNALKHGKASHLVIRILPGRPLWQMSVQDNGRGLPKERSGSRGMGLRTMRYRAEQLGGEMRLHSLPEGGTRLECTFQPEAEATLATAEERYA